MYFWQQEIEQEIKLKAQQNALPHAILLTGIKGLGKREFAKKLTASLLCTQSMGVGSSCGNCESCLLSSHPDYKEVDRLEGKKSIGVEQIRELAFFLQQTKSISTYKVVTIFSADKLNIAASNCLLKTLEEPTANTIIILVSNSQNLLPTIKSRTCMFKFKAPEFAACKAWLQAKLARDISLSEIKFIKLAANAPLMALSYLEDTSLTQEVYTIAQICIESLEQEDNLLAVASLLKFDFSLVLQQIYYILFDLVYLKFGLPEQLLYSEFKQKLDIVESNFTIAELFNLLEELSSDLNAIGQGAAYNKEMLLNSILLKLKKQHLFPG